jgi:hypothetical protein
MDQLRRFYLPVCAILLFIALGLDYFTSSIDIISRDITVLQAGKQVTKSTLTYPFYGRLLQFVDIFFYTLAASIFVSFFVTNRLEEVRQKEKETALEELRKSINIDVFNALFQMLIPAEIFGAIKEGIIKSKVVRRGAFWIYDFTVSGDEVQLRQTLTSELHNVGGKDVVDPLNITVSDYHSATVLQRVTCMIDEKVTNSYDRSRPESNKNVNLKKEGALQTIEVSITIPPQKHAEITLVSCTRYPKGCVKDCYFTKAPLIGAKLLAMFPTTHVFEIFQSFSTKMTLTLDEPGRRVWELKGGILPHQGFQFSLRESATNSPSLTAKLPATVPHSTLHQ